MAQPYDPNTFAHKLPISHRQWVQSVQSVLQSNVDMGTPTGSAPNTAGVNAGVYTQFQQGNGSGILIRIAATASTDTGAPYNWDGSGAALVSHNLKRQPIGFHVVDQDGPATVHRTAPPTTTQIALSITDATVSVTVYVF